MRVLCVAEKPSIAKSITEILSGGRWDTRNSNHQYIRNYDFVYDLPLPLGDGRGANFTVTAVLGHLTSSDFHDNYRKWSACEPFALFEAPIVNFIPPALKAVEQNLQNEARRADVLMIWTDCDREGEHIGSEVVEVCRKVNRGILVKRARFSAIIPAQIHQAASQANALDLLQADAVSTRISLDLRIGSAFTRLITLSLQPRIAELSEQVISYGPCQFPTLGFVVEQYNRVQAFVPETFWYVHVALEREHEDGERSVVEFKWSRGHLFYLEMAAVLYEQVVETGEAIVTKVESKPTTKWKPLPLTTVELQQSGSRLLHMTPKKVLDLAEKLYQKGFLSYPRTETDQYDFEFDFQSLLRKQTNSSNWGEYSQRLLDGGFQKPRNGKKNDKAHPPIHPTNFVGNLEGDEKRVYEFVTRRFLANCSKNAEGKTTTVDIEIAGESFSISGLIVLARNYLEVYPYDKWAARTLPDFQEGELFVPDIVELKEGTTTKPNLLTEADLVGLMDKNGIGTDATIAEHIAKIIERSYVTERQEARNKYLVPSSLGIGLVKGFNAIEFDRSLSKPHLRRETEHRMQLICDGVRSKEGISEQTLDEYKEVFVKARREFHIVINSVLSYLQGEGEEQEALRAAARGTRGTRGTKGRRGRATSDRGGKANGNDDEDDDGPPRGGGAIRARGISRSRSVRGRGAAAPAVARRIRSPTFDELAGKQCKCLLPAISRVVNKADSIHKGKKFWTCSKPQGEQCGFFEWENDDVGSNRSTNDFLSSKRQRLMCRNDKDDSEHVECKCGLEAVIATVSKDGTNKGRKFWACPNNPKARCGFFQWQDDPNANFSNFGSKVCGGERREGGPMGECYKCHQAGHWASNCPKDSNGEGSSYRGKKRERGRGRGKGRGKGRR
ncbi:hypothetical protein L204_104193 [Cryptococcus depauperatus]